MKQTIKSKALIAGAITGGLAGASNAATVQITLTGNMISSSGGNQLVADITGDLDDDLKILNPNVSVYGTLDRVSVSIGSRSLRVQNSPQLNFAFASFAFPGYGTRSKQGPGIQNIKYLNPVTFTDLRINGGDATEGFLEVNSIAAGPGSGSITLTRFVFDDASTARPTLSASDVNTVFPEFVPVPEPSSLTLLALGAGGLIARRNRKKVT